MEALGVVMVSCAVMIVVFVAISAILVVAQYVFDLLGIYYGPVHIVAGISWLLSCLFDHKILLGAVSKLANAAFGEVNLKLVVGLLGKWWDHFWDSSLKWLASLDCQPYLNWLASLDWPAYFETFEAWLDWMQRHPVGLLCLVLLYLIMWCLLAIVRR